MSLLEQTIQGVSPQDKATRAKAKSRLDTLVMPHWALGRLMDLALDIAGITRSLKPALARKTIIVMAGDHGVVEEGVSKYPREVTTQMMFNFVRGGAGINVLARLNNVRVIVVDMGVAGDLRALVETGKILSRRIAPGTRNMAKGSAMTREQAVQAIEAGIEIVNGMSDTTDVFGTGDMGIGNTTPSAAIATVITGVPANSTTGRGTGIDDRVLSHKVVVIEQALRVNRPNATDGLDVLAKVGGFEIGGIAGVILGAAARGKPVVIDGFISTAAALIAQALSPAATDYIIAAHCSAETGHKVMLKHLGKEPLLDLGMRLGEGTGAALAMNLVEAAGRVLSDVATFGEASVSGPQQ